MKFLQKLAALLCMVAVLCTGNKTGLAESADTHSQFVYGQSEMGRDLICHRIGSADAAQSILIVFGVHGFEDAYDHDGEVLKLIAEKLIAHYTQNITDLKAFCLYIIPSANPDGLIDGTTTDGFGRCNFNGIDINRDFPFDWAENNTSRNQTGKTPLSTAESRAICDLVQQLQPTYGIDVHGWAKGSFGNGKMAEIFAKPFDFKVRRLYTEGALCAWLNSVTTEGFLLELPSSPNSAEYVEENSVKLMEGLDAWIAYCTSEK